jgi:vitamin B12 transporter
MRKVLTVTAVLLVFATIAYAAGNDNSALQGLYDGAYTAPTGSQTQVQPYQQAQQPQQPQQVLQTPQQIEQAQQQMQAQRMDNLQKSLGDVVVTARDINEVLSVVPKDVEIIKPSEASLYNSGDFKDMLDEMMGVFVNRTGIGDSIATLSLNGAGSRYTLIMQDGIPVNDMMTGGVDLNMIDPADIEKIEVVRGGMSSIYGSDAVAGAINIITGSEAKKLLSLTGTYGTDGLQKYAVESNSRLFNMDYSLSFDDQKWDAYFVNSDSDKMSVKGRVDFSNDILRSQVSGHYFKREMGVPGNAFGGVYFATPKARQYDEDYSAGLSELINVDTVNLKVDGYLRSSDLKFQDPAGPTDSRQITKEYQASMLGIYGEGGYISAVAGYVVNLRTADSTATGDRDVLTNAGIANASARLFSGSLIINAGGRYDNNSQYGSFLSENAAAKYKFPDGLEMRGSFEKSFSAPTFSEAYWVEINPAYAYANLGNPNLKPEEFTSYEAGIKKQQDKLTESVIWSLRDTTNKIENQIFADGMTTTYTPMNIQKDRTMGLDAQVIFEPFKFWTITAQYNLLFIEDQNTNTGTAYVLGGNSDNKVYRLLSMLKMPYDIKLGVTLEYVDYKKDYTGQPLTPYLLLGAKATQKLNDYMQVYLEVDNIMDNKEYQVVKGYPMPGRIVEAGATIEF